MEPRSYQQILERGYRHGRDFRVQVGNLANIDGCLLVAPHGGAIEPGTTEIMRALADVGGWAYYHFDGLLHQGNSQLHITSTLFDEPKLLALLPQTDIVVSFHGAGGSKQRKIYVGGLHDRGRAVSIEVLNTDLAQHNFLAIDAVVAGQAEEFKGMNLRNITNGGRLGMGVQFEFSRGARLACFETLTRAGRRYPRPTLSTVARSIHRALAQLVA